MGRSRVECGMWHGNGCVQVHRLCGVRHGTETVRDGLGIWGGVVVMRGEWGQSGRRCHLSSSSAVREIVVSLLHHALKVVREEETE